jgi:hypothetical protein
VEHFLESFQKRDRDRKKIQKRNVKEARRRERAERRRNPDGSSPPSVGFGDPTVVPVDPANP